MSEKTPDSFDSQRNESGDLSEAEVYARILNTLGEIMEEYYSIRKDVALAQAVIDRILKEMGEGMDGKQDGSSKS